MKRAHIAASSAGLLAALVLVAASCGSGKDSSRVGTVVPVTPPAPVVATAASSAAPNAPSVDLNDPSNVSFTSWTDEGAVLALAKDCNWDPGDCVRAIEASVQMSGNPSGDASDDAPASPAPECMGLSPLACAQLPEQSCAPDPCYGSKAHCTYNCDAECANCATRCTDGCGACKSKCEAKDDACRLACARSCGACRQGCLKTLDHCSSADCNDVEDSCYKKRDDDWTKGACSRVCPKVQACIEKTCGQDPMRVYSECATKCFKQLGKGCPSDLDTVCIGEPNALSIFETYRAQRHPKPK